MNDVMSGGIHRLWKDYYVKRLSPDRTTRLLDVAGGTGDIAFRFLDEVRRTQGGLGTSHVTVVDINPAMLEVGKEKAKNMGLENSEIAPPLATVLSFLPSILSQIALHHLSLQTHI